MYYFAHSGKIGDLLYGLCFCKDMADFSGDHKFNFHILTDLLYEPNAMVSDTSQAIPFLSKKDAEFLLPFLKAQPFINKVTYGSDLHEYGDNIVLVSDHANEPINTFTGDIRQWYYSNSTIVFPKEYWKPIFSVKPDYKFKDKILFTLTPRYVNCYINFNILERYKDNMVFLGTEKEYNDFCQKYFKMDYAGKFTNLLEIAQILAGAKGYMANPTGLYAVAEGLKIPRALVACDYVKVKFENGEQIISGPSNVLPLGGINKLIHTNIDLEVAIQVLSSL